MGDPDLAQTIAEVQGALERLRISVQNQAHPPRVGGTGLPSPLRRSAIRAAFPPALLIVLSSVNAWLLLAASPLLTVRGVLGLPGFGQRKCWLERWPLRIRLLSLACALLCTLCFAVSASLAPPAFPASALSELPWGLWRTPTPSVKAFPPLLRPGFIASLRRLPSRRHNEQRSFEFDGQTAGTICIINWPPLTDAEARTKYLASPLLHRPGAFLVALPAALQEDVALLASGSGSSVIGPSGLVSVPAVEEAESGEDVLAGFDVSVLLLDLEDLALQHMSPFDPPDAPHVMPSPEALMRSAIAWVGGDHGPGLAYVTAQEDSDAPEDPGPEGKRAAKAKPQVRVVSERQAQASAPPPAQPTPAHQKDFPAVGPTDPSGPQPLASLAAALPAPARLGATPKIAPAPAAPPPAAAPKSSALPSSSDSLATAIAQQGQALTLLVSHLASQGDALDLSTATAGLSSKGSAKRERLQQELAQRSSTFFLQVCQNGRLSFVTYMERFGGYGQSRDLALVMHQLSFVSDCFLQDDVHGAREHLALPLASTEQAAQDRNWTLAYLLCLLDDPAPQVYASRAQGSASRLRVFTPLVSPAWASTALSYVREIDAMAQRTCRRWRSRSQAPASLPPQAEAGSPATTAANTLPPGLEPTPLAPRTPADVSCPLNLHVSPSGPCLDSPDPSSAASSASGSVGAGPGQPLQANAFSPSAALSFRRWATLHLNWCGQPAPDSVFLPLPVPCPGAFRPLGHSGQRRRQRAACQVALHAVVVALNFVYNDCAYVPLRLLARPPNSAQARCLRYLRGIVQTFGDVKDGIFPSETGRRMNSLIARLSEVSQRLTLLGPLGDPYSHVPAGLEVPTCNDTPDLEPYRSLCAERLRLSGRANWDPAGLFPPDLAMAYALPSSLLCGRTPQDEEYPRADRESTSETLSLALKWSSLDLLHLEPSEELPPYEFTRIFNAYKSVAVDRQIGDRRGQNAAEARLPGPSRWLPSGESLCALSADAKKEALLLSMSDRRDFYHQILSPWARNVTNRLYPSFPPELFRGTRAYDRLSARCSASYLPAAGLSAAEPPPLPSWPRLVQPCFRAVLQGDHIGVELAVACHERLLIGAGLLSEKNRLYGASPVGPGPFWDALVIDDYFSIARVPRASLRGSVPSPSSQALDVALECYEDAGLIGSPEKDLRDQPEGKAAGAEINSSLEALSRGHITVAAPAAKRLALSDLTLEISTMPATTDCLHACVLGAWTSIAMFRRPLVACFQHAYGLCPSSTVDSGCPKVVPLPRKVAAELQLVSVLAPVAVSDISVLFLPRLFATDSSESKGAFVSAAVPRDLSKSLWLCSDRKGAYSRMTTKAAAALQRHDPTHEEIGDCFSSPAGPASEPPVLPRPIAYRFDFLELFIGPPDLRDELLRLGFSAGPHVDFRLSSDWGLQRLTVLDWVLHMIDQGHLLGVYLVPPCSTSLPSAKGSKQSRLSRWGIPACRYEYEAFVACVAIFRHACSRGICALLKLPSVSTFLGSAVFLAAAGRLRADSFELSSCAFGDHRLRSLWCLCTGLAFGPLHKACTCTSRHLRPRSGSATKGFKHCAGLIVSYGRAFALSLRSLLFAAASSDLPVLGLERQCVNDLAVALPWQVDSVWSWVRPVHINILEASVLCRLYKEIALTQGHCRFVALCDSFVALSSLGKGRSSSNGLRHSARRSSMICLAAGLYPGSMYTPTRLMPADHPTRDHPIPPPVPGLGLDFWTYDAIKQDSLRPRLRRWASSWVRLALLLRPGLSLHSRDAVGCADAHIDFRAFVRTRGFDSTKGFPGEWPLSGVYSKGSLLLSLLALSSLLLGFFVLGQAAAMDPRRSAKLDAARALSRAGTDLRPGRPVQRTTQDRRDKLKELFVVWLGTLGISWDWFTLRSRTDPDFANEVLVCYGQHLYKTGKSYSSYSEALNMFSSACPSLRRLLQPAWDLAFSWQREEPPVHHTAMPWQVVTALISVALIYGWVDLAGVVCLCWGGLARVGEVLEATRSELVLPSDVGTSDFKHILLSIREPKTRFKAARHQSLRVDQPQMLRVIIIAFGALDPAEKLWRYSGSTLRNRFKKLLFALKLPPGIVPGVRDFDLGSLRAGGATWLMEMTENPDYVRRRGRWITQKVMEIYIQEVAALTFLPLLPPAVKQHIFSWAGVFAAVVDKAELWHEFCLPPATWKFLTAHGA
ncbi:unnamed protein product [Symbiodinium sp. CCMP2592]|nr:unnamed protein product [Symbiodinium sp. CCMP2592]